MKRALSLLLAVCMLISLLPASIFAAEESAETSNTLWEYEAYGDGIVLTAYAGTATDVYVPAKVDGKAVIKLGDSLFENNDGLNSVTLAEGITEIGARCFYDADNLVCIVTNETLTTIGAEAFYSCDVFNSVIIYDGVATIGEDAFAQCPKLTVWCNMGSACFDYVSVNGIAYSLLNAEEIPQTVIENGVTYYISNGSALVMSVKGEGRIVIPSAVNKYPVTRINEDAFSGIYELFIPDSVTTIGAGLTVNDQTVIHCGNGTAMQSYAQQNHLPYILVQNSAQPESVTQGDFLYYVYGNTAAVKSYTGTDAIVEIPAEVDGIPVTKILPKAFQNNSTMIQAVLPDTIDCIYSRAFYNCSVLQSINIPSNVKQLESYSFYNCSALSTVNLHNGIERIKSYALATTAISDVTLPDALSYIGAFAFQNTNLTQMTYPESVELEENALVTGCLTRFYVSESVEQIDFNAFASASLVSANAPLFYVYEGTGAHNSCLNNGAMFELAGAASTDPYEYDQQVAYYDETTGNREIFNVRYLVFDSFAAVLRAELCVTYYDENWNIVGYGVKEYDILEEVDGRPVTVIMESAFQDQLPLEKITIPETVTAIGINAFSNCTNLNSINLPASLSVIPNNMLQACGALTVCELPDNLLRIGDYAFANCGVQQIVFPDTLIEIGNNAFAGSGLQSLSYPKANIGKWAFAYCYALETVTIESDVTELAYRVFEDCKNLVMVYAPNTIETFNDRAFPRCPKVIVVIDDINYTTPLVKHVKDNGRMYTAKWSASHVYTDEYTLDGITYFLVRNMWNYYQYSAVVLSCDDSVTGHVTIPEKLTVDGTTYTVERIGVSAFAYKNITSIDIPNTVRMIDDLAFQCVPLTEIDLPEQLDYFGVNVYNATQITEITFPVKYNLNFGAFAVTPSLTKVTIPEGVKRIPEWVLYSCGNVTSLVLPESLEFIEKHGISEMRGIKKLVIPGKTELEKKAVHGLIGLETLIINEGMTRLEENFSTCTSLSQVYLPKSLTYIDYNSFSNCPKAVFCVYRDSYAHKYCERRGLPYCLLNETANPEIAYGTGITGAVSYTDGTAAAGATVEILYSDGTTKETVTTDATGAYSFTYAEVGAYTIRATDTEGNTATTQVSVKRMNAFDVFLSGDTALTLKKSWTVSGTVSESPATVTITDLEGNLLASTETTDGSFQMTKIPNGTYILTATTEKGSVSQEVTVFDGMVSDVALTIAPEAATVWGYVKVEDREGAQHLRNWVQISIYNAEGIVVAQTRSDETGKYTFSNLPLGEYTLVAEVAEMRPDKKQNYDRSHTLTGYGYILIEEVTTYQLEDIILRETSDSSAKISGKVTAQGENQACEVILINVFRQEVARYATGKNGKYTFVNISDGMYIITATTESDGMGFTVVVVRNGCVYGETDIQVYKTDKIKNRELQFDADFRDCQDREGAAAKRERIAEEKRFYDGLSEKEKKQLSKDYVLRLTQLVEWISQCEIDTQDNTVTVEQGGLVVSGDELESEQTVTFHIDVTKTEGHTPSEDGVNNSKDFIHHDMKDKVKDKNKEITQYYEITMSKTVDGQTQPITSVYKDTEATGKFRITMEIPEEYRGHKHYSFLHVHCGEVLELTDLDDDPDTVTFEVDKFSTFALTYTDVELTQPNEETEASITSISLRPSTAGIYFKGQFNVGQSTNVDRYGIAVSVYNELPVADDSDETSLWTQGDTSVLISNILSADKTAAENGENSRKYIYARAYILLTDGTYIYGNVVKVNLKQIVTAIDAKWDNLTDVQKEEVSAMYDTFRQTMSAWDIPKIKETLA